MDRTSRIIALLTLVMGLSASGAFAQSVTFMPSASSAISEYVRTPREREQLRRESVRVERFLTSIYPTKSLRRAAGRGAGPGSSAILAKPFLRKATYAALNHAGRRFLVAGFTARWDVPVNQIAIYQIAPEGIQEVWRSAAWQGNYYGLDLEAYRVAGRPVIMVREGASDPNQFGIAGVFTFSVARKGKLPLPIWVKDITPSFPHIEVTTSFPFKTLYGQGITLRQPDEADLELVASDEAYQRENGEVLRREARWKYDRFKGRFEMDRSNSQVTTLTVPAVTGR